MTYKTQKHPQNQHTLFVTIHFFTTKTVNLFVNINWIHLLNNSWDIKVSFDIAKEINIICTLYTFFHSFV